MRAPFRAQLIDVLERDLRVRRQGRRCSILYSLFAERTPTAGSIPTLAPCFVLHPRFRQELVRRFDAPRIYPGWLRAAQRVHRFERRLAPVCNSSRLILATEAEHGVEREG